MKESLWALVVIGVLVHRMLDLYGVYHKWMQVHRFYVNSAVTRQMPRSVKAISENFDRVSQIIILVMIMVALAAVQNFTGTENSLAATIPAICFSLTVSFFGAFADYYREQTARL